MRKNKKRIDPRYFLNETTYRDLGERLNRQQAMAAIEFARAHADTIRQQGGRMHKGDLLDHGVSGQEIRNFIGAIQVDPTVGQLEQGNPNGARIELQGDGELVVIEAT